MEDLNIKNVFKLLKILVYIILAMGGLITAFLFIVDIISKNS